jgi:D-alanyl-D-alanine dipeptidase
MKKLLLLIIFTTLGLLLLAQPANIITNKKEFASSCMSNSNKKMANLKKIIPSIVLDLRYKSKDNFTNKKLYKNANTTYMRVCLPLWRSYKCKIN